MERLITVEEVRGAVEKIGFNYIADRLLTTHREDWYLRVVTGFRIWDDGITTEYAVWLYNADRKEPVLVEGYYTDNKEEAIKKYRDKH